MRAVRFDGQLKLERDIPRPEPADGDALIRVTLAGICNTDLEITRGYFDFKGTLGHEFVGRVLRCPSKPELVGQRVVGEINAWCGECPTCRRGDETHCPNRTTLGIFKRDGAMAEYVTLPAKLLYALPDSLPDEVAVFAEPLAAAVEITERLHVKPTDRVIVIGDGKLGLLIAQVLQLTGCDLTVIGRHDEKLGILWQLGIKVALPDDHPSEQADIVVEATGNPDGFDLARKLVKPRGKMVLKSTYAGELTLNMSMVVVDELALIGSRCGPFAPALRLLEQGLINVDSMVTATYPLSDALQAFEKARERGALKVLLTTDED